MPLEALSVSQRVLIVWLNPLFRESAFLLLQHPEIEWLGAVHDYETVRDIVLSKQPDTIVVEEAGGRVPTEVMAILEEEAFKGRLVSFSLIDNRLHIFHREEWNAAQADDLLHLILQY